MKPQRVIIPNDKGEKLVGYLYKGSSKTLIIICHGIESVNNCTDISLRSIVPGYLSEISRQSRASVFSFDFSGFGESEGKFAYHLKKRHTEIKIVIDTFSREYEQIILYGFSWGGITAAIAAEKYKEVTGLITINGFFTYKPTEIYFRMFVFYYSYILTHIGAWSELFFLWKNLHVQKIKVPVLVVYSDTDTIVNPKQSMNFFRKLKTRKKTVSIHSDEHSIAKENRQIPPIITEWIKNEKLK